MKGGFITKDSKGHKEMSIYAPKGDLPYHHTLFPSFTHNLSQHIHLHTILHSAHIQQMMVAGKNHSFRMVFKWLHCLMLLLSAAASAALFLVDSFSDKLLLGGLLLAYALFLARSSFLRPNPALPRAQHVKIQQWNGPVGSAHTEKPPVKQEQSAQGTSFLSGNKSFIGREESLSSFRGQSTSYLNDSHLSGSHRRQADSRGNDLFSLLTEKTEAKSIGKSTIGGQRGMQIMERKAIARRQLQAWRAEGEKGYEEQLIQTKKTAKHVQSRYQIILNSLHSLLQPILTEHNANNTRLNELSQQFLDIILDEKAEQPQGRRVGPLHISSQQLLKCLLEAHVRGKPLELTGLPLRSGKKWNDMQKRVNELIRARIRLGESLSVPTEDIGSQVRNGVGVFMSQYATHVLMLEDFVKGELGKRNSQSGVEDVPEQGLFKEFRSRIFALHLYVRHLNGLLRGTIKIGLQDQMGLQSTLQGGKADMEITPRHSFDAYVPYYNLWAVQGGNKKCYPCEYGANNYLSLIYFLLLAMSARTEIRERPLVVRIINDTL